MNNQISFTLLLLLIIGQILSAQSDNTPAALNNFTISESCIDVSNNAIDVVFTADLYDETGVESAVLLYKRPNGSGSAQAMNLISGSYINGTFETIISYDNNNLDGLYLFGIEVIDSFNNILYYNTFSREILAAGFQDSLKVINIYSDVLQPVLDHFTISESCIDVSNNAIDVYITAEISDDLSGVSSAVIIYKRPNGSGSAQAMNLISGNYLDGTFEAIIPYDNNDLDGLYVFGIEIIDSFNNILYYNTFNRELLAAGFQDSLKVINIYSDAIKPVLNNFTIPASCIDASNNVIDVSITAEISDNLSGVSSAVIIYKRPNGSGSAQAMNLISGNYLDGTFEAIISYDNNDIEGLYVFGIEVIDSFNNILYYNTFNREILAAGFQDSLIVLNCPLGVDTKLDALKISNPLSGIIHISEFQDCHKTTIDNNGVLQTSISTCNISSGDIYIECGNMYLDTNAPEFILTSPNGQCWKILVDNNGLLQSVATSCQTSPNIEIVDGDLYFEFRVAGKYGPILKSPDNNCWQITLNNQLVVIPLDCP